MNDLKTYLELQAEQDRLSREISEAERAIAVKKKEIQALEDTKSVLVYQSCENAEVLRKMEEASRQMLKTLDEEG